MKNILAAAAASFGMLASASAANISDFDISNLTFELDSVGAFSNSTTTGDANGVGFTYVGFNNPNFTNTDGSRTYETLPGSFDSMHITDGTFTFDVPVQNILLAIGDDRDVFTLTVNAGQAPDDVSGRITATADGFQFSEDEGGLALFTFAVAVSSITLDVDVFDGYDVSVFVLDAAEVPVPAAALLMAPALAGFALRKRAKR